MGRSMFLRRLDLQADSLVLQAVQQRLDRASALIEALRGETPYLAGKDFTAADLISVFSLTTMRYFLPCDSRLCPSIRASLPASLPGWRIKPRCARGIRAWPCYSPEGPSGAGRG
ncbi:MAG: hypothetical protein U1E70_11340 [Acetobacteraceae bacterium]